MIKEIRKGYKQTKLGWIPEDWEVKQLWELALENRNSFSNGPFGSDLLSSELQDYGIPVIYIRDISRFTFNWKSNVFVTPQKAKQLKASNVTLGDVLITKVGSPPCEAAVYENEESDSIITQDVIRIRPSKKVEPNFLMAILNSQYGQREVHKIKIDGTRERVSLTEFKKIKLPLPSLEEQQKIATILSAWDKAIALTQQILAAKEEQKRGLMQRLLTGKVRVHGFEEEWLEVKLGGIFTERKERGFENLELLSIGAKGVYPQSKSNKKDNSNSDKSKYKRICPGDIGYNTMRMWQGRSAVSSLEGIVSPAYTIVTPTKGIDVNFMGSLFKLPQTIHSFWSYSQGLVNDTLNCKYPSFALVKVKIPPTIEEQIEIGEILKTADSEIDVLRKKIEALQEQKKGLMQQLLTGKIRVQ